ncbi:ABC transporter substrate-binding protein [Sphingomonas sp. SFZ2018-12]|uniref:ABC transporter substrate-binding protein n=1 Tax=Sphingomonas sp. SFZ2018-12 TaxID=2683197 RepID=UPI001F0D017F|nr:ABC transporter substrate-binding protein [Sphingomonas sp. SFZ2018-12]MCH4893215.1 ABC transporter substrate-binding protein [Sphingomonas sp. SFZ2018-12]
MRATAIAWVRAAVPAMALALASAGCTAAPPTAAGRQSAGASPRVVSINPCVDAVLMQVADPRQIAGISHYSQDPRATSIPIALARRFTATSGTAEEVVALDPDLVIAGAHVEPSTIAALRRLDIALVQIGVPATVAESDAQIRTIAAAIGRPERGEALVRRIDAAVRAARTGGPAVPALIWQGGGLVPGTGTLADELLRSTGFANQSARYGLKQWDVLPLEPLVARPPRLLLSVGARGQDDRMLGHPVLDGLRDRIAVRPYPDRLLNCGGPTIIDAVGHLARVRRSL